MKIISPLYRLRAFALASQARRRVSRELQFCWEMPFLILILIVILIRYSGEIKIKITIKIMNQRPQQNRHAPAFLRTRVAS